MTKPIMRRGESVCTKYSRSVCVVIELTNETAAIQVSKEGTAPIVTATLEGSSSEESEFEISRES